MRYDRFIIVAVRYIGTMFDVDCFFQVNRRREKEQNKSSIDIALSKNDISSCR